MEDESAIAPEASLIADFILALDAEKRQLNLERAYAAIARYKALVQVPPKAESPHWSCTKCAQVSDAADPPSYSFDHRHQWVAADVPAVVQAPQQAHEQALVALEFAQGAIYDAIGCEDGLDGRAGERVIAMIRAALDANGRPPLHIPVEDEAAAWLIQQHAFLDGQAALVQAEAPPQKEQDGASRRLREGDAVRDGVDGDAALAALEIGPGEAPLRQELTTDEKPLTRGIGTGAPSNGTASSALVVATVSKNDELDAAWLAISRGWDIEPREYFEQEAPRNGFKYPLVQAIHHMWKRELKERGGLTITAAPSVVAAVSTHEQEQS